MRIQKWSNNNGLLLNAKKCCLMVFGNQSVKYSTPVKIHTSDDHDEACACPTVTCVTETKYLGVVLDDKMTWKAHVDSLIKKLRPVVACIAKLGRAATRKVVLQAYHALFESHIRYGILAYGSAFCSVLAPIERIQNCCVRIMSKSNKRSSAEPLYDELGVLPLRKLFMSVMLTQLHTRQTHIALNLEKDNAMTYGYATRGQEAGHIRLPTSRPERTKRLFTRQYLTVYNSLPGYLKSWTQLKISQRKKK